MTILGAGMDADAGMAIGAANTAELTVFGAGIDAGTGAGTP